MIYPKIRFNKDKRKSGGFAWKRAGQRSVAAGFHPLSLSSFRRFLFWPFHRLRLWWKIDVGDRRWGVWIGSFRLEGRGWRVLKYGKSGGFLRRVGGRK